MKTMIGQGQHGTVYGASSSAADGMVVDVPGSPFAGPLAVKTQRATPAALAEAKTLAKMSRCAPGVVPHFVASGVEDGRRHIVMERIDGVTLAEYIAKHGSAGMSFVAEAERALRELRACGLRGHGDFHPGNVMIARSGRVVIIDFGQAGSGADNTLDNMGLMRARAHALTLEAARKHRNRAPSSPSRPAAAARRLF